jgi:hypothetical protein
LTSRFDLFQELEGLDYVSLGVLGGFEIAESGLGPVVGIGEAAHTGECNGGVVARQTGAKATVDSFTISYGLRVLTQSYIDAPGGHVNISELAVNGRPFSSGLCGEGLERQQIVSFGAGKMA